MTTQQVVRQNNMGIFDHFFQSTRQKWETIKEEIEQEIAEEEAKKYQQMSPDNTQTSEEVFNRNAVSKQRQPKKGITQNRNRLKKKLERGQERDEAQKRADELNQEIDALFDAFDFEDTASGIQTEYKKQQTATPSLQWDKQRLREVMKAKEILARPKAYQRYKK